MKSRNERGDASTVRFLIPLVAHQLLAASLAARQTRVRNDTIYGEQISYRMLKDNLSNEIYICRLIINK